MPDRELPSNDADVDLDSIADLSSNSPVSHHLIAIARDLQGRVLERLREEMHYEGLRPSLGPFLSLIWMEGRPLSAIAERLGISKQACSQLARVAERSGYLALVRPPATGRARLVMLSARGRSLVEDATRIILETESEYAEAVGVEAYRRFVDVASALFDALALPPHADAELRAAAGRSIGILPLIAVEIQERLRASTTRRGHPGLKPSHAQVLPRVGRAGARIRDLARMNRVSRQSISVLCQELEGLGYLKREPDPEDGRGAILRLTRRGESVIACSLEASRELEASFRASVGEAPFLEFVRIARDLWDRLRPFESLSSLRKTMRLPLRVVASRGEVQDPEAALVEIARKLRERFGERDAIRLGSLLVEGEATRATGNRRAGRRMSRE